MRLRTLAVLVAGLSPLMGCTVNNHSDASRLGVRPAAQEREYSSSWIASRRGGAALRDAGYQQVLGTPSAISPSPAAIVASQPASGGMESGLFSNLDTRSVKDAQQSAIANSMSSAPPATTMKPYPVAAVTPIALSAPPTPAATTKKAPVKKRAVKKKAAPPAPQIKCEPGTPSASAPDSPATDGTTETSKEKTS